MLDTYVRGIAHSSNKNYCGERTSKFKHKVLRNYRGNVPLVVDNFRYLIACFAYSTLLTVRDRPQSRVWLAVSHETRHRYGMLNEDTYIFDETGFRMGIAIMSKVVTSSDTISRAIDIQPGNREWTTGIGCINASG